MPTVALNICCPRDCVSRHNGGTSGAPLKPFRDDSALRALSSLRGLRGAPEVPPLCGETSVSRTANVGTVGKNGLIAVQIPHGSISLPVSGDVPTKILFQKTTRLNCSNCHSIKVTYFHGHLDNDSCAMIVKMPVEM